MLDTKTTDSGLPGGYGRAQVGDWLGSIDSLSNVARLAKSPSLITLEGKLSSEFDTLLRKLKITNNGTAAGALGAIKDRWYRGTDSAAARSELALNTPPPDRQELYRSLGAVEARYAPKTNYGTALLMGGLRDWIDERLGALIDEWNGGVRINRLVMLGGPRPIDPKHEDLSDCPDDDSRVGFITQSSTASRIQGTPVNELEMMKRVFHNTKNLPSEWGAEVPVEWDFTSMSRDARRKDRPNTADTVAHYLERSAGRDLGDILVISSQPFVDYQVAATKAEFKAAGLNFANIDGIGRAHPQSIGEWSYINILYLRLEKEIQLLA